MQPEERTRQEEERFKNFLKVRGYRATPERFRILHAIMNIEGHFDAELVLDKLEKEGFHISKATLYSTFDLLCESGIIKKLHFSQQQSVYELSENSHSHLVCMRCGKIIEFQVEMSNFPTQEVCDLNFDAKYMTIYIYGICENCKKLQQNINNNLN